jgi:hypothetical protein
MQGDKKVLACLSETAQKVWDKIKEEIMNKPIGIKKHWAQAVLDSEGGYIIYKVISIMTSVL